MTSVSIVGSGYVGTTIAACLADIGHDVINIEIDEDVVAAINAGDTPIHEPGLERRIAEHAGTTLRATTDYGAVTETDLTFLCLPTPQADDGSLDLSVMRAAARSLGDALAEDKPESTERTADGTDTGHLVVVKSTVLPGTTEDVVGPVVATHSGKQVGAGIELAMNPEFLRMGSAVSDFLEPDKIVLGVNSSTAGETLRELYAPLLDEPKGDRSNEEDTQTGPHLVETDIRAAELIKYANNAFLAAKVSLVNEIGNIAKGYGVDAYDVFDAVGLDDRISSQFLRSGLGWGGSCFPKDVNALRAGARELEYEPELLDAVVSVNDGQPRRLVDLLAKHVDLAGARIAVLGLSFKPHTDDVRSSRALEVIETLIDRDATVVAYDPVAIDRIRETYPDIATAISFSESAAAALDGADGAVVATDWPEFDDLSFDAMANRILVDGRRIDVDRSTLEVYEGLTW